METRLTLLQVTTEVEKLTQFEKKVEELETMVKKSKDLINYVDPTKEQLATVKSNRIELRSEEINIEKQGKEFRDIFTAVNKSISRKQKELTAITSPEIERLAEIESEAKKKEELRQREILLPTRKERLVAISTKREYQPNDEELLKMDSPTFESFYNTCVSTENDCVKQDLEKQQALEDENRMKIIAKHEKEIADQKAVIEENRKKIEDDQNAKQKEIDDKQKVEQEKIDEANRSIEAQKVELAHQKEMQEADSKAKTQAEEDSKREAEKKEKERLEKIELEEGRALYKKFMKDHGWTPKNREEFESRIVPGGYELWHNLGKFNVK